MKKKLSTTHGFGLGFGSNGKIIEIYNFGFDCFSI
jgi:hypothetical protein